MIRKVEIEERVREWGLREDIVEKDYVLGWLLWGIGSEPTLSRTWAFKGGTCLKKCYVETWRFSEDLDFTVMPGGSLTPADLFPILKGIATRLSAKTLHNMDFRTSAARRRRRSERRKRRRRKARTATREGRLSGSAS